MNDTNADSTVQIEEPKSPHQERTVTIVKCEGFDNAMEGHQHMFQNAIGYLSEWAMWQNRFVTVRIGCYISNGQPELSANYRLANNDCGYAMGGIWDDKGKRFTFHS